MEDLIPESTMLALVLTAAALFGAPKYAGSGCPAGSIAYTPTPTAFTVLFDSFVSVAGTGAPARANLETCTIHIPVTVPAGMQFAIDSVDWRGFAKVDAGGYALLSTYYRISGKNFVQIGTGRETLIYGPKQLDLFRRDKFAGAEAKRWSPCGGSFDLTLSSYVITAQAKKNASAYLAIDSSDGAASLRPNVSWRKCPTK
jgi:hypothetical protein